MTQTTATECDKRLQAGAVDRMFKTMTTVRRAVFAITAVTMIASYNHPQGRRDPGRPQGRRPADARGADPQACRRPRDAARGPGLPRPGGQMVGGLWVARSVTEAVA